MPAPSAVNQAIEAVQLCQTDICSGMDLMTEVAFDLVQSEGPGYTTTANVKKIERMMLELAKLDREMGHFATAVKTVHAQAQQDPNIMKCLDKGVKDEFARLMEGASAAELNQHNKIVAFRESISSSLDANQPATEQDVLDEDVAVTQSQFNFTCPLTQVDMVNPVKNKKCQHYYDQEAVLSMINSKQKNGKQFKCPVIGCGNKKVTQTDLVQDPIMKRRIQRHQREKAKTSENN